MIGLLMKLIVCPLTLIIADYLFAGVNYGSLTQAIIVGVILAVGAHLIEVPLLRKTTNTLSAAMDFLVAFLFVYVTQYFLAGATITLGGALLTAVLLTITEIIQHTFLIGRGMTRKSD